MRIRGHILPPPVPKMPAGLLEQLIAIYPEGHRFNMFGCSLQMDDPRFAAVTECLRNAGLSPRADRSKPASVSEFSFSMTREYEPADLAACTLLELRGAPGDWPTRWIPDAWRSDDGRIELRGPLKKSMDFGKCNFEWHVVPHRVKVLLAAEGLKHVCFRKTIPMTRSGIDRLRLPNWSYFGKPWWELDSDFTLPPLSPAMTFTNRLGNPVNRGDYSNGFHRVDGSYNHAELHYRDSDLNELGPFDLARTAEPFSNRLGYDPFDRPLVASKRFYDLCVAHNLKADWVPVRID